MKLRFLNMLVVPMLAAGLAACDVQQEEQAELPDVQVEEGQLPEYEVETGDVEVEQDTVTVPELDVETPDGADANGTDVSPGDAGASTRP